MCYHSLEDAIVKDFVSRTAVDSTEDADGPALTWPVQSVRYRGLHDALLVWFSRPAGREQPWRQFVPGGASPATPPHGPTFHVVTRKPLVPTADEVARNPRARSARLRVLERTDAPAPPAPAEYATPL